MEMLNSHPIAVLSFNRPDYLRRTLLSIKHQMDDVSRRDVCLFQDGSWSPSLGRHHCDPVVISSCIDVFRELFPRGEIFSSETNLGSVFNYERAETHVFHNLDADAAVFLEDDLVLGRGYLRVLERLLSLALANEKIGYVTAHGNWRATRDQQIQHARRLRPMHLLWAFGLTRRHWLKCKPYVSQYYEIIRNVDYRRRDHVKIRELVQSWGIASPDTGQDRIKAYATALSGCVMLNTEVVYGKYIGKEDGLNFTPAMFQEWGLENVEFFDEPVSLDFDLRSVDFNPWHDGANIVRVKGYDMSQRQSEFEASYSRKRESFLPWERRGLNSSEDQISIQRVLREKAGAIEFGANCFISPDAHIYTDQFRIGARSYVAGGAIVRGTVQVGSDSTINAFAHIAGRVVIGNGVRIASNVSAYGFNHGFADADTPIYTQPLTSKGITIGDGTWIGASAMIVDGVKVGVGCIIGGGSVVTKDVEDFAIVAGNPAKIISHRRRNLVEIEQSGTPSNLKVRSALFPQDPFQSFVPSHSTDLQGWDSVNSVFGELIRAVQPKLIVEVGTWKGASAIHMAQICRQQGLSAEIVCIDTWLGNWQHWSRESGVGSKRDLDIQHGLPRLFWQFMSNVVDAGMQDIITPLPLTGVAGAKLFKHYDWKPDIVYIDGDHEYESVLFDLRLWMQQVSSSGVLIGDDYNWPGVKKAADDLAHEFNLELKTFGQKFTLHRPET